MTIFENLKNNNLGIRVLRVVGGAFLFAFGLNVIVTPLNLYSSGFTGIAMLLKLFVLNVLKLPQIPGFDYLGIIYYLINAPLFYFAYKIIGKKFCITSVISIAISSLAMSLVPIPQVPIIEDYLTAAIVGGIISGTGAGLIMKAGTSGGGNDIVGVCLAKTHPNFGVGKISIVINLIIYAVCFALYDIQIVVYSMIFAVVNGLALDYQHTQNINVQVMIFTKKEGITDKVIHELQRGLTYWKGAGGYTDDDTYVLMTMISKYELHHMIDIVKTVDPQAFVMVNEGTKIFGNFEKRFDE